MARAHVASIAPYPIASILALNIAAHIPTVPFYDRFRVQFAADLDDLPPAAGGFTVWLGSYIPIWEGQWAALKEGERHTDKHLKVRKAGGYADPAILRARAETASVDTYGSAGTVVCGTPKSCTWQGRIPLAISSARPRYMAI